MTIDESMEAIVRVRKIRNQTNFATTLIGIELDDNYNVIDHTKYLVVSVSKFKSQTTTFFPNEVWRFSGKRSIRRIISANFVGREIVLDADESTLMRESGDNLIEELCRNEEYIGIGHTLARRLWETFGDKCYEILDNCDLPKLKTVLKEDIALNAAHVWREKDISKQIRWLEFMGINSAIGNKCVNYYKSETKNKITDNPYRLLPFSANWDTVDKIAKAKFEVTDYDSKRLFAAVDHATHTGVSNSRKGHTAFTKSQIKKMIRSVLSQEQADMAFLEHSNRSLVELGDYLVPTGYFVQEKYVAMRLSQCINDRNIATFDGAFEERLLSFENTLEFPLTNEQRMAIKSAVVNRITILTGGAGCGKTTTLVGMIDILQHSGFNVIQMALSGRAALRMTQASGKEAHTIASFISNNPVSSLPDNTCLVVDEASMVSLNDAFAIIRRLPHRGKIILIGDPVQLPPIGAGLFFKPLATLEQLACRRVELTEVKRQSESTGIPRIAEQVRNHAWPELPDYIDQSKGVSMLRTTSCDTGNAAITAFKSLHSDSCDVRILTPLKASPCGTDQLNIQIQELLRGSDDHCMSWSRQFKQPIRTGYKIHDKVVFLKNDYKRGLRNGSLGVISKNYTPSETEENLMDVIFEEGLFTLSDSDLDNIQLAYAMTIHKAQGSQFDKVIIPIVKSALTDQSLLYTALTRSVEQAIFVGTESLAKKAIESPPTASSRQVGFTTLMLSFLKDNNMH